MRKLWIDTDTASDDAVALLMALREPSVQVLGISVVMGNVSLERAVRNALISVERAGTYAPPVYAGANKPLYRDTDFAVVCHGVDGLSDRGYPDPAIQAAPGNAVDAMLDCARANPGEVELVTLGPLTNVALALGKYGTLGKLLKRIVIMGGSATSTRKLRAIDCHHARRIAVNCSICLAGDEVICLNDFKSVL